MAKKKDSKRLSLPRDPVLKELVRIRNLQILALRLQGASTTMVDKVVRLGASEIRRILPSAALKTARKGTHSGH